MESLLIAVSICAFFASVIVGKMILSHNRERQELFNQLLFLNAKIDTIMSVTDDIKADVQTLGTILGNLLTAAQTAASALAAAQADGGVSAADAAAIKAGLDAEIAQAQQALAVLTPAAPATPPTETPAV